MLCLKKQLELERCPHCGVDKPNLYAGKSFETADHEERIQRIWVAYTCARCGGVTVGSQMKGDPLGRVVNLFPSPEKVDDAVPERAKDYLQQALKSTSAPAGAVMLAASAIDAMLKAKGHTEGSLYSRIDKAASEHVITNDMALWAHEVRLDANDQRHADPSAALPDQQDARHVIEFAMALGQFMFVLPSRVRRGIDEAKAGKK